MAGVLIVASARCVWSDLRRLEAQGARFDAVMAIKSMIALYPERIDYAASLHPEYLAVTLKERAVNGFPMGFEVWVYRPFPKEPEWRHTPDWGGSSGLFGVKVARELGFDQITLAGMPMNDEPRIDRAGNWKYVSNFWPAWEARAPELLPCVRSVSGRTADLLGRPDAAWLA